MISSWKMEIANYKNTETHYQDMIDSLKNQNNELNKDIAVLKRLVYMLNVELEFRESVCSKIEIKQNVSFDWRFNKEYLKNSDIQNIEPLLRAFDQTKKEKDELLSNYKRTFDEFSQRCKDIVSENCSLRQQLCDCRMKAESSLREWQNLHEKFILTEEHNKLLARQVKLYQNKYQNVELVYRKNLKRSDSEKKELNEEFETVKNELLMLKGKLSTLSDVKVQTITEKNSLPEATFFPAVIGELKKLSSELKVHHNKEIQSMKTKLRALESLKGDLEIRLTTVTAERDHLEGHLDAVKLETRQINFKLKILEDELQEAKKRENETRLQLLESMAFIRELISSHTLVTRGTLSTNLHQTADNLD